jgi:predicted transposase YdaD
MPRRHSDSTYKLLFSSPLMVRDLLRGFVPDPWLDQINPDTLRPLPASYVTSQLRLLHADMVWQVDAPNGSGTVLLHIEFQSNQQQDMPLRMVEYATQILRSFFSYAKQAFRAEWPPLLSIVLYNGKRAWHRSTRLGDYFRKAPAGVLAEPMQHRFVLIDIHRQDPDVLDKMDNLVALIMRLEQPRQLRDIAHVLVRLKHKLLIEHELRRMMRAWALSVLGESSSIALLLDEFANPEGTAMTLADQVEMWIKELGDKGRQVGRLEGRQEGAHESQAKTLIRLLSKRFGPPGADLLQRLQVASNEELTLWLDRVLDAQTLDEVFVQAH